MYSLARVLLGAITSISWPVWGLAIGGFLLAHLLSSFKWRLLLHVVGVKISVTEAIRAHAAGLFANLALPFLPLSVVILCVQLWYCVITRVSRV